MNFSTTKIAKLFSTQEESHITERQLLAAMANKEIPNFLRKGSKKRKSWTIDQVPLIGEKFGLIKKPNSAKVMYTFVTKGGVLKSSLCLNLARLAALHNIKTCVVGLDMQGDVTSSLGFQGPNDSEDIDSAMNQIEKIKGLPELFFNGADLSDLLQDTDLPNLKFIPETPELVAMERALSLKNRREYWLKDNVIEPLKQDFDLIIVDGSPNWNLLTTNALVSCDLLLSPLECKINNFRNFKMFDTFITEFRWDMNVSFEHIYIPTRLQSTRKLSAEIYDWYKENLGNCSEEVIKESTIGEEATALHISVSEYASGTPLAHSYNRLLIDVFRGLVQKKSLSKSETKDLNLLGKEVRDGAQS